MMSRVSRFVNRNDVEIRTHPSGNDNQTNHAPTEHHRRASDLRVKVPVTRLEAKLESSNQQKSTFDDTELEDSTVGSINDIAQEQLYVASDDHNRFSPALARPVVPQRYGQQYGQVEGHAQVKVEDESHPQNGVHFQDPVQLQVGPSFWAEVDEARRDAPENDRYFRAQSPSIPSLLQNPIVIQSNSSMPSGERAPSRPRPSQKAITAASSTKPNKSTVVVPQIATTHTTTFDKTSSYTDSSAETTPPFPKSPSSNKKKRPICDLLDHDPATLKAMTFSDLDNQPFDLDPRRPTDTTATAPTDTHLQKLQTLKSISDSERATFFASQTKDQWDASTEFFEKRLAELFKELRVARGRKRDVAVRFESEVRERMVAVEGSAQEIESCLAEMRGKARGVLPPRGATPAR